jgi:Ig-like domain from next to BRCA1 gene
MKRTGKLTGMISLALMGSLILSACGASTPEPSPTVDIGAVQTSAVETFAAGLTQTAFLLPTDTPTPAPTNTPTIATTLKTPLSPVGLSTPVSSCNGLTFVKDVTIPDNTLMTAGQTFTKTWRVRNSGTCPWDAGFKFAFVGGEAMDGATLVLDSAVGPGSEKELSIAMKAPNKIGSLRGTWRMSTAGGTYFGDQVFVLINVGGTTTVTTTVTKTTTAGTSTATKTVTAVTPTVTATTAAATATPTATTAAPTDTPTETPTTGAP